MEIYNVQYHFWQPFFAKKSSTQAHKSTSHYHLTVVSRVKINY